MSTHRNIFSRTRLQRAITTTLTCSGLLLTSSIHSFAVAQENTSQEIAQELRIEAGDLGQSLTVFAARHNIALSFDPSLTKGLKNALVTGKVSPIALIDQLLLPTDLMMIANGDGTYSLVDRSQSASEDASFQLDAVIVTGEKISRDIKDTTTAVTVVGEESYENGAITDVNDIATQVPNVETTGFGGISIRGVNGVGASVGSNAYMTGASPRVTTSVDGVTEAWGGYNYTPVGLWDTQAVEVLRGPQSTSQGANAIAGALVLKTNDPSFTSESAIRLGMDSYDNGNLKYNLAAMNSGALIEDELAYRLTFDSSKGEGWLNYENIRDDDDTDYDDSESLNFRGKLLWEPADIDGLSATLNLVHRNDEGEYLSWVTEGDESTQTLDLDETNTRVQDSTVDSVSINVDYQISDTIQNTLQISNAKQDSYFIDSSSYTTEAWRVEETTAIENRVYFTPNNSKFSSLIGLYTSETDILLDVDWNGGSDFDADGDKRTLAIFGETAFSVNEKLEITAGGRIDQLSQDRIFSMYTGDSLDYDETETIFLPKLSATYDVTDATTLGASIRKGYNAGGSGLNWDDKSYYTFDKEEVTTLEFSSKTRLDNMTINASIFHNDYTDYQAYTDDELENVDSVTTYGAEVEVIALLTDSLELRGSVGTLSNTINATSSDTSGWDGNEVSYAPDLSLSVGFTKYIGDNWLFGADIKYVGEYYSDLDNTESLTAGDYVTADARIQYVNGDFTIDGYITNLTNEEIVYFDSGENSWSTSWIGQTRTIGLSATYRM